MPTLPPAVRPVVARVRSVVGTLALLALPTSARTQAPGPAVPDPGAACIRQAPPSAYTRVPVFVHAEVADTVDREARASVDLVAQEVAGALRTLVWTAVTRGHPPADTATTLPPADSVLRTGAVGGWLRVVARRGGVPLAWRARRAGSTDTLAADTVATNTDAADTTAAALLGRALDAAMAAQAAFVPDFAIRGDSLAFDLRFVHPTVVGPARALEPIRVRNPAPAFSLPVLWEQQATAVPGTVQLRYPSSAQRTGYTGRVQLEFVVDTNGRAEPRTVHDVWLASTPRPVGADRDAYTAFVDAGRAAVLVARFHPATIAGCPVRQLVRLPLTFSMNR